jgi:uncharacterized protein (TIGR02466 family)
MFTPIFTEGVWDTTFSSDLKNYCNFVRENDKGRTASNKGGYQSKYLPLDEPVLQPLIQFVEKEAGNYSNSFKLKPSSFKIESMWININGYKDHNEEHIHTGSFFSGVYYIHTPVNCGNIEFVRPNVYLMGKWQNDIFKEYNTLNSSFWQLPSRKDKCYLFPAYYKHKVEPNLNTEERYSLSFNISLLR